ncbi:MAG: tRNA (adenosine(37)-N6)-threonylcarbamoyltransferase complex dimerization subunit type 1 TsaB [Solirubrobacterales bacterium]|nr:tRNA (adenosine(37)-N6)-threonylcarbamoyltransferase complex dimerization subunit type 1 TsaB [Solirubrobacterales bacterium]
MDPSIHPGGSAPRDPPVHPGGSAPRDTPVVVGFDTATATTAVAVTRGGEVVRERGVGRGPDGRPRHAATLLPEIEAAISDAGGWERVGLIAVGVGPGSFTGLRIGVATARALAQARGLPLVGVGSLAALARGIEVGAGASDRPVLALIDARRGELFAALRPRAGAELSAPFVTSPEALIERVSRLAEAPLAAGDGSLRFRAQLEAGGVEVLADEDPAHRIRARHVCDLATEARAGRPDPIEPIYLRRPDAEVWRDRRERDQRADRP